MDTGRTSGSAGSILPLGELRSKSQTGIVRMDANAAGDPINIGGLAYERGIGVRRNAELVFDVPPGFARLEAWVGLDNASPEGCASFQAYLDDQLVFDSSSLHYCGQRDTANGARPVGVKIPLEGGRQLRLAVTGAKGVGDGVLADWGGARLVAAEVPLFAPPPLPTADTLASTPPMGWNNWNDFGVEISDPFIREMADALIASGLKDAGYQYMCLDDGWQGARGDEWNAERFPRGMKVVGDYVHAKGLKFGLYTRPEWVRGEEQKVASALASWGIDYLKYDFSDIDAERSNGRMLAAIRATGRPIVFNVCEWGKNRPWEWGAKIDGQSWRVTYDVVDMWSGPGDYNLGIGFMRAVDQTEALGRFQSPGRWNDPDMLVVGLNGRGFVKGGGCTPGEYRTHFGLWCLLSAPLLVACDLRAMDTATRATLTNPEVIALDQDALGVPAWRARKLGGLEIWQKPLGNGDVAVGLLNRGDTPTPMEVRWADLYITGKYHVRDLWERTDLGVFDAGITRPVDRHELALLRLARAD